MDELPTVVLVPLVREAEAAAVGNAPAITGVHLLLEPPVTLDGNDPSFIAQSGAMQAIVRRHATLQSDSPHAHPVLVIGADAALDVEQRQIASDMSVQVWLVKPDASGSVAVPLKTILDSLQCRPRGRMRFDADGASAIGTTYSRNMDAYSIVRFTVRGADGVSALVADGVGSQAEGDVAARIAAAVASEIPAAIARSFPSPDTVPALLIEQFGRIREALRSEALARRSDPAVDARRVFAESTLSTTVVGALLLDDRAWIWWAGDSRAYLLHEGRLALLTRDHSVGVRQKGQAADAPPRAPEDRYLTFVAAPSYEADCDVIAVDIADGDVLLLCSDGICEDLPTAYLESLLNLAVAKGFSPREVSEFLIQERWTQTTDNITAVVIFAGSPHNRFSAVSVPQSIVSYRGLAPRALDYLNTWGDRSDGDAVPANFLNDWSLTPGWLCRNCRQWGSIEEDLQRCPRCGADALQTENLVAVFRCDGFISLHALDGDAPLRVGSVLAGGIDPEITGEHAELRRSNAGVVVRDLDTLTGTWELANEAVLNPGEPLRIGSTLIALLPPYEGTTHA